VEVYGDPVLDSLIDEALAHNANVMLAIARVDEARAALSVTSADQRPQINANASRSRTRVSQRGSTPLAQGVNPEFNDTRVAAGVSYEIDLWGGCAMPRRPRARTSSPPKLRVRPS